MKGILDISEDKIKRLANATLVDHLGKQKDIFVFVAGTIRSLEQELIHRNKGKIKYKQPAVKVEGNLYRAWLYKREHRWYDVRKLRELVPLKTLQACEKTSRHDVVSVSLKQPVKNPKKKKG